MNNEQEVMNLFLEYEATPMTTVEAQIYADHIDPDVALREINYRAGFKAGFKSRDEEVELNNNALEYSVKERIRQKEEITALRAQIEEMKCCGNCYDTKVCSLNNGRGKCNNWERRSK